MTIQALAWAIDQQLPPKPKLVLMALANHADHSNGKVDFTPSTIAWESSAPQRSIWKYLGALERNGFLKHIQRGETAEERDYWLLLDRNVEHSAPWFWDSVEEGGDDSPIAPVRSVGAEGAMAVAKEQRQSLVARFDRSKQIEQEAAAVKAVADAKPTQVFVREGTPAFEAWCEFKSREIRRPWRIVSSHRVEGRSGNWFPTLFPPGHAERELEAIES